MSRMKGVADGEASALQRMVFRGAKAKLGEVPEPIRLMAKSSSVMWAGGLYEIASGRGAAAKTRHKSLASLKVASMVGCVF